MASDTATADELQAALTAFRRDAKHATFDTGRYRMPHFVWGSGPPLVFIHGMADAGPAFVMVMHHLVARFTCIGYELPDGQTDGSHLPRYTLADYTADLFALLGHLRLDRVAVLGSSFGSLIALAVLAGAPERFTHGILESGFACRRLHPIQRALVHLTRYWPGRFGDWPEIHRFIMRRVEPPALCTTPPEVASYFLKCAGRTPICASSLRSITIGRTDLRALLPAIGTPVLLLTADQDRLVSQSCWDELMTGLPNARRLLLPGSGHYPHFTQPGPMAGAMAAFLSSAVT